MNLKKIGLLPKVIFAIIFGTILGVFGASSAMHAFDEHGLFVYFVQLLATFNLLFGQFLLFTIPLIIIGLIVPGIADFGKSSGRLLLLTLILAYSSTVFSGYFSYFSSLAIFPKILASGGGAASIEKVALIQDLNLQEPFFSLEFPPAIEVTSALLLAFIMGIGIAFAQGNVLKNGFIEFREIMEKLISAALIPLLPLHIFGLFLNMAYGGTALEIILTFGKVIAVIFVLHLSLLLILFSVAGAVSGRNPLKMLWIMLPAYVTALGTSSSAATIPVTLRQAKILGIRDEIADFSIPLCATIHLSGSMLKITATALAICMMNDLSYDVNLFSKFIFMLGIMMVAAPGVPGGAIMAATGALGSILGFDDTQIGLMIAIYIAIDSFGTAGNVTGDGAIAAILDRLTRETSEKPQINSTTSKT